MANFSLFIFSLYKNDFSFNYYDIIPQDQEELTFKKESEFSPQNKEEIYKSSLFIRQGSFPVLLTAPHDGTQQSLNGFGLPSLENSRPRDMALRCVARDIYLHTLSKGGIKPSLIVQRIHRAYVTDDIQAYFEDKAASMLTKIVKEQKTGATLLDLHGFTKQPEFGDFDLILGTGHRETVKGTGVDLVFSEFMAKRGYRVYAPPEEPTDNELYGATNARTLVQKAKMIDGVVGIQIEVARHFRTPESTDLGKQLSSDIGDFIMAIGSNSDKISYEQ